MTILLKDNVKGFHWGTKTCLLAKVSFFSFILFYLAGVSNCTDQIEWVGSKTEKVERVRSFFKIKDPLQTCFHKARHKGNHLTV